MDVEPVGHLAMPWVFLTLELLKGFQRPHLIRVYSGIRWTAGKEMVGCQCDTGCAPTWVWEMRDQVNRAKMKGVAHQLLAPKL